MSDLPERPAPPSSLLDRARTWLEWVGPARVAGSALAVVAVVAGAYWLVKPPTATTESTLPYAPRGTDTAGTTAGTALPAAPSTTVGELVVHVAGAVAAAGVYRVPAGSRVVDAVQLAGGLAADAQPDAVNLAAMLVDGQRVYVPHQGEVVPVGDGTGGGATAPSGPVNLNTATAGDLDALPGVGPATAAAIIEHRELHGPFGSVDDLADVRGIGPAKVAALRGLVTV